MYRKTLLRFQHIVAITCLRRCLSNDSVVGEPLPLSLLASGLQGIALRDETLPLLKVDRIAQQYSYAQRIQGRQVPMVSNRLVLNTRGGQFGWMRA
jgi:hypothetical protein